ncbi:hypothetical protein C1645_838517 [Glomus cerebriforme]|uniref:Uncharacterized protein n=1 Tax=Glomus cerebriforme TaxID=658196 RepID=A0A397S3J9_9GLOM|nr:hypothetical protein C1645_838517 [Glomus cerebriforme]
MKRKNSFSSSSVQTEKGKHLMLKSEMILLAFRLVREVGEWIRFSLENLGSEEKRLLSGLEKLKYLALRI